MYLGCHLCVRKPYIRRWQVDGGKRRCIRNIITRPTLLCGIITTTTGCRSLQPTALAIALQTKSSLFLSFARPSESMALTVTRTPCSRSVDYWRPSRTSDWPSLRIIYICSA